MKRKILSLLLVVYLSVSILTGLSVSSSALSASEITEKMNQLKNSYPSNTYWNHKAGDSYDGYYVTNTRCGVNGYTCNELYGGKQCYAFARHIAYLLFGSYPQNVSMFSDGYVDSNGWTCVRDPSKVTLEPGDYVRGDGHSGIVWYVSGENVYVAQCFGGEKSGCKLNWGTFWGDSESKTLSEILSKSFEGVWKHPGSTSKVTVNKTVKCLTRITIKASAPLYRSATTNAVTDPTWDKFKDETSIWAKGYVDLSNGERRYYFNAVSGGDNETHTYYVPTTSLNSIVPDHTYGEAATEHPHIQSCECGATKESTSKNAKCYTCYPAKVVYYTDYPAKIVSNDINADTLGDYVYNINQGTYPEFLLNIPKLEPVSDTITFLGWSQNEAATRIDFYAGMNYYDMSVFAPGKTLHLYAVWEKNDTHNHIFAAPRKAHPHWQMCECGIGETYYDSSCQLCTNPDAVSVVKSVICYSKITMLPYESLYTTPVPDGNSYSFGNQEMEIYADGYVILSTGEKRYFYNGDPKYYISEFSLSDVQVNHLFNETDSTEVHPHYLECECGATTTIDDNNCYACYPAYIYYYPNFDDRLPYVQKIDTSVGRWPSAVILRNAYNIEREGYTLLGWSGVKDETEAYYTNEEGPIRIWPGFEMKLYAIWKENAHTHTMEHHTRKDATCLNTGTVEYWLCTDCGKYYLDANAANETTAEKTILPALGHNYVNGTCTRCSAKDPNAAEPDPNAAVVSVVPVRGKAGQTVEIAVTLENNPGFADLGIEISYDTGVMQLTNVTPNNAVGGNFTTSQQLTDLPYMFEWVEGTENNTFTGTLVTLTFQIKDSAELGSYPVTVSYYKGKFGNNIDGLDVNYDQDDNRVPIIYVNGSVTVYSYTPGDLNDDGRINSKDVICLLRYIAGWELDGLVEDALDVNGDGKINSKDAVHLLRYIAGWDVTLH